MLWPDWPESSARANLRRALANLRSVISDHAATPPFLSVTPQTIAFDEASDAWVDVVAFSDLTAPQGRTSDPDPSDLEHAVTLYRGEFLEGFSLSDSPLFEEWTLFSRERFHRLVLEALQRLVRHCRQSGQHEPGLAHAWRQVELDPWREEAHRQLVLLLAATGQRSAALAQYETCRQVLAQELGTEPSAGFQEIYERLLRGERLPDAALAALEEGRRPRQVGPSPYRGLAAFREQDSSLFFGRERFIRRLVEAVQRQPMVAVIVGSSGCGKSSAVFAGLLPRLRHAGDWLIADCRPGAEPFRALTGALLPILSPGMGDTDRLLETRRMAEALSTGALPLVDIVALALERDPPPGACCWWWISSRSCTPSAPHRRNGGTFWTDFWRQWRPPLRSGSRALSFS
jgi:DNA-binding SARP family transcriptional activator